jgi:hypothetical protein
MSFVLAILLASCMSTTYCVDETVYIKLSYADTTQSIRASDYCGREGVESSYMTSDRSTIRINCKCKAKDVE